MAGKKEKHPGHHNERHSSRMGQVFRNIILGGQDGVVNVLGIVLGVAASTGSTSIVLLAGLAATFAESISMAAVAYTSSRAEAEHYRAEMKREIYEIDNMPECEREEIEEIFKGKGFSGKLLTQVVDKIVSDRKVWLETMMRDELKLENPEAGMSSLYQAILVGSSAIVGSLVPVAPFFFMGIRDSMALSLVLSMIVLFSVGAYKSRMMSGKWIHGGIELMVIGGAAALVGYLVGALFQVPVA
ncbi:MAG: VIT1/CCC1 transporter family protein [Candidatus Micrarchaeota archaeon]